MDLLDFAKVAKDGTPVTEAVYVELMKLVVPLDELLDLEPDVAMDFCQAVAWLSDYSILLWEFYQLKWGPLPSIDGAPCLLGPSGPFIENILTRGDKAPDFNQLVTFGVKSSEPS